MSEFFQSAPQLSNQFSSDRLLRFYLRFVLPPEIRQAVEPGLEHLGERAVGDLLRWSWQAECNPPRHVPYDPWGRRVDHIEVSEAWNQLHKAAAEEGIVATAYARKEGRFSRIHQFSRLYLYHPSSAIYSCPLAMTDGAARAIELYGDEDLQSRVLPRLTSSDPEHFWTSGQWMTERTGGSDVSGTSTVARLSDEGYRLFGTKWFTSATTSNISMALARIEGDAPGSRGLSLFYLELRQADGALNGIRVHRLKDKLGTRALPTAELTLEGAPARLVGGPGGGVKKITSLMNITRLYNACCAVGYLRRGLALARDYAHRRVVFGRPLSRQPLHLTTLAGLEVEFQGAFFLTFRAVELLGKDELGEASEAERALLRLLTPIVKLYTARLGVAGASEVLEMFGGAGYVEDTGLPTLLRNAQVLSIWEGTTNVLSLDMLRAIEKEDALLPFEADTLHLLEGLSGEALIQAGQRVKAALHQVVTDVQELLHTSPERLHSHARSFAFGLARIYTGALMLNAARFALDSGDSFVVSGALRWCAQELNPSRAVLDQEDGTLLDLALD